MTTKTGYRTFLSEYQKRLLDDEYVKAAIEAYKEDDDQEGLLNLLLDCAAVRSEAAEAKHDD